MPSDDLQTAAKTALIRHLKGRQRAGENHIWLTEDARRDLLKLRDQEPAPTKVRERSAGPLQNAAPRTEPRRDSSEQFSKIRNEVQKEGDKAAGNPSGQSPSQHLASLRTPETDERNIGPAVPTGQTKRERLDSLVAQANECRRCDELGTFRETMVFSVGDPDAEIMLVGEAPGAEEEVKEEPFVGPAGQLLTKIIGAMGLDRSRVYISNICKYRPRLPNQTSNNRKPTGEEMDACLPFILAEVETVRPKVVIALGGTAMEGLLGVTMSVAKARESVHDFRGVPLIVTYHPSYLLRNTSISERRKVWEDMMRAMEIIGMPISEKQRSFFRGK